MGKKEKALLLTRIVLFGFLFAFVYHGWIAPAIWQDSYPYNTFLFHPGDRFNDLFNVLNGTRDNPNPYVSFLNVYFPFTYLFLKPLTYLRAQHVFWLFMISFCGFLARYVYRRLDFLRRDWRWIATFVLSFLTYPALFLLDRANLEAWVFIALAMTVHYQFQERDEWKGPSWLAATAAIKGFPAIFGALYLRRDRTFQAIASVILGITMTIAALLLLPGDTGEIWMLFRRNLEIFQQMYVEQHAGLQHNTSLFGALKLLLVKADLPFQWLISLWPIVCLLLMGSTLVGMIRWQLSAWKQVAILTFLLLLLPFVSFDYRLIHLMIPVMLFLNHEEKKGRAAWDYRYAIGFGLLLIPKAFVYTRYAVYPDISIAVVLNPLLMLGMIGMFFWEERESRLLPSEVREPRRKQKSRL